jgi:hypothetical protein
MTTQDPVRRRRKLTVALWVWLAASAFWLLATVLAGATFFVVLLLGPIILAGLAYRFGLDGLPAPVVYLLGCLPAVTFPMIKWYWPIGLLLLAMIFAYEKVLEGIGELRLDRGDDVDEPLAVRRAMSIGLVLITADAYAAGMDHVLVLLSLVAIWRFTIVPAVLALLGVALTAFTFLSTGEPALFAALDGFRVELSTESDWLFTAETMAGALLAWGGALWWLWRTR